MPHLHKLTAACTHLTAIHLTIHILNHHKIQLHLHVDRNSFNERNRHETVKYRDMSAEYLTQKKRNRVAMKLRGAVMALKTHLKEAIIWLIDEQKTRGEYGHSVFAIIANLMADGCKVVTSKV